MIDWNRVRELQDEVGAEDFDEILELFFSEVEIVIEPLTNVTDATAMAADLHFLRSGALNLGFSELAKLCAAGEITANSGTLDGIDPHAIQQTYEAAKSTFTSNMLKELAS
ncbi:MAG: Hpt domain-containing protein [Sulfitobacter sp.]